MQRASAMAAASLVLLIAGPLALGDDVQPPCAECHDSGDAVERSVHAGFECTDCHVGVSEFPHDAPGSVDCGMCHEDVVADLAGSIHALTPSTGGAPNPTCADCHGAAHGILPLDDPASPLHGANQATTCAGCHIRSDMVDRGGVRTVRPIEAYEGSVHSRAVLAGKDGARCSNCHSAHAVLQDTDPRSSVHKLRVADTCGTCHREIARIFQSSIHGRALAAGVMESPSCTDCHGEHHILGPSESGSPVFATNLPVRTCGRCHGDVRINEKYGLSSAKVSAYRDSYHGLAGRAGSHSVANCASCHGVHDILPSSDSRSHVHADNLAATCGKCHPGAGSRFALGPVHVQASQSGGVTYWIRAIYLPLIVIVVGGMFLHNLIDFLRKAKDQRVVVRDPPPGHRIEERMRPAFRVAHLLVVISFSALVVTGFALTYPESWWAKPLLLWEDRLAFRGWLHRAMGVLLMSTLLFHGLHAAVDRRARRVVAAMVPSLADLRELRHRVAYNLGWRKDPPSPTRLGYIEKSEYLAFMWGTVLMSITGIVLWFENVTLSWLPGWVPEAATALHFYEAILATAAIVVWHFYWVVFDPLVYPIDTSCITGHPPAGRAAERGEIVPIETTLSETPPAERRTG